VADAVKIIDLGWFWR